MVVNDFLLGIHLEGPWQCFCFSILSFCTKNGNQPQKDLAKSDYKTNAEVESPGILLHTSLNPMPNAQMCVFDGTYYKMMLNDVGVHDIILYWFLFSLFLNL